MSYLNEKGAHSMSDIREILKTISKTLRDNEHKTHRLNIHSQEKLMDDTHKAINLINHTIKQDKNNSELKELLKKAEALESKVSQVHID